MGDTIGKSLLGVICIPIALSLPQASSAEIALLTPESSETWVNPTDKIRFRVETDEPLNEGNYAVLIGSTDVTSLFHQTVSGEFQYTTSLFPLPSGESELTIFRVSRNNWQEIGQTYIRVLTPGGYETSEVEPRLDVSIDAQIDEGHSDDAGEPDRTSYRDLSLNGGLSLQKRRGDLSLNADANISGASNRDQALRYYDEGEKAPKLDLSDYLVEVKKGDTSLTLGHSTFGQNPLLISSISNRGLTLRHRFSDRIDVAVASQNGTSIVGYNNFFGLRSFDHNISGGSLGYEFFPSRAGALRMELSYVTAEIESETNFNVGEVPDAEKSHGYGLRLLGRSESGRLRGDLSYARSTYTNPEDEILSQGLDDLVPVKETSNSARRLNLSYDILSDYTVGESTPINLTISVLHERIDPLYKTLAAFPTADLILNQVEFVSQIGNLALQLQHSRMEDNLDDLATILKTKTENTIFNAAYDFSVLYEESDSAYLWPSANLSLSQVRQYAANNPDEALSGFNGGSHLPDQRNLYGDLGLSWSFDTWDLSYTYSYSHQDNLQVGREDDDFKTWGHEIGIDFQVTDDLTLGVALGRTKNENIAEAVDYYSENVGFNFDWSATEKWAVSGSFDKTLDTDSDDSAKDDAINADLQVARRFSVPFQDGRSRPGQFYLRYSLSENKSLDNVFDFNSFVKNWTLTAGISFSFF